MAARRIEKSWTWHLRAGRESLWPLIADTERMNEAMRLPRYHLRESVDEDGMRRRHGEHEEGGAPMRWEEMPFEWSENHWWRWERRYESGPFERASATLVMEPEARGGGTVATYTLSVEPRGLAGAALARTGHLTEAGRDFERLLKLADAHARKPQGDFYANLAATRTGRRRKKAGGYGVPDEVPAEERAAAQQLLDWLAVAFESDLRDIRAKRVARALGIGPGEAHTALVTGAAIGALERRFRLVCAACRATVREEAAPRALPRETACPRCGAAVEADHARGVEVVFAPHSAFRTPSPLVHCASGPGGAPRIVMQQTLDPHERRDLPATLAPGDYVLRTLDGAVRFDHAVTEAGGAVVQVGDGWIAVPETGEGVALENHGERTVTLVVERADWPAESTSLAEWLTYQRARESTPPDTLDLDPPQGAGMPSLVVISARGDGEAAACRKIALAHDGAVVADTGSGTLLVFWRPASARQAMDMALQLLPAARIGADCGPLAMVEDALYAGEARERVGDLAGLAQEGVPNLSAAFREALGA